MAQTFDNGAIEDNLGRTENKILLVASWNFGWTEEMKITLHGMT